jgi:hypothetical protein
MMDAGDVILDLAVFLWLHPSDSYDVLLPLVRAYFQGGGRIYPEVEAGMRLLYSWAVNNPANNGDSRLQSSWIPFEGKAKLIFDLIFADEKDGKLAFGTNQHQYQIVWSGDGGLFRVSEWLKLKKLNQYGMEMLYQWDGPLQLTFAEMNRDAKRTAFYLKKSEASYAKALYRIAFFDIDKEGDTVRTRTVNKLRGLLDREDNVPELNQLWQQVKSGELQVKNPWLDV